MRAKPWRSAGAERRRRSLDKDMFLPRWKKKKKMMMMMMMMMKLMGILDVEDACENEMTDTGGDEGGDEEDERDERDDEDDEMAFKYFNGLNFWVASGFKLFNSGTQIK